MAVDAAFVGDLRGMQVAADEPRGDFEVAAARNEHMGLVAHADHAAGKRLGCAGCAADFVGLERHLVFDRAGQVAQARERARALAVPVGKRGQRLVDPRDRRRAAEHQRREAGVGVATIARCVAARVGFDHAMGPDADLGHRLVERQHVQHVAVAVARAGCRHRGVHRPLEDPVARRLPRGKAEVLRRRAHRRVVAVGDVVDDVEFHTVPR